MHYYNTCNMYTLNIRPEPNFLLFCSATSRFRDTRFRKIGNALNDPEWHWTLKCQSTLYTQNTTTEAQIFVRFVQQLAVFKVQDCRKSEMRRMIWEWHWTFIWHVKRILYTLNTCPQGPNFGQFHSMANWFWDTRLSKIENASNDLWVTLNNCQSTLHTLNIFPRGPEFHSVSLYDGSFSG